MYGSASEVTTLWRYTNLFIIIINETELMSPSRLKTEKRKHHQLFPTTSNVHRETYGYQVTSISDQ